MAVHRRQLGLEAHAAHLAAELHAPLDVSEPAQCLDANGRPVKDLGFTYSVPTIAMTNVQGSGGTTALPSSGYVTPLEVT